MKKIKYKIPIFNCVNCSKEIPWTRRVKLYCSEYCQEEAIYVRYYRRCIKDGRIKKLDVQETLKIRLAHLNSGGYSKLERIIPIEIRNKIIKRDKGKCQICGQPGNEIDHIKGNSINLDNLQLLCNKCHIKKSLANIRTINPDDENYEEIINKDRKLELRIIINPPLLECDDEINWNKNYKNILLERKIIFLKSLIPIIKNINNLSQRKIALYFNFNKIPTFSGYSKWDKKNIREIINLI